MTIVDSEGNAIDVTFTNEEIFGTGASLPGRGFILNNELTDFNFGGLAPVYPTQSFTGTIVLGSSAIAVASISGFFPGQFIYDNNTVASSTQTISFPNGTTIISMGINEITVSQRALLSSTTTFIATPPTVTAGAFSPGGANEVAAFKRPRSSICPTITFLKDNTPFVVIGSAGGSAIIPSKCHNNWYKYWVLDLQIYNQIIVCV